MRYSFENFPTHLRINIGCADYIPPLGEYFVAQLDEKGYVSGVIEKIETAILDGREQYFLIIKLKWAICTAIERNSNEIFDTSSLWRKVS